MAVDTLLLLGTKDEKLRSFMRKMGYGVVDYDGTIPLPQLLQGKFIDLAIIDPEGGWSGLEVVEFLRAVSATKDAAIIHIARTAIEASDLSAGAHLRFQIVKTPYRVGQLASTIATELRLRKMAGADDESASLAEANAALRELNARFAKELREAREIQQDLLPEPLAPDPRFQVAASYQPLDEVGGDWYYIHKTPTGKIAVEIADVTGHGLSAALIGSMTKLALTAAGKERPSELLARMNELMSPAIPQSKFVTMFAFCYDPATGVLEYARAGHPPALLLSRKTNTVSQLMGDGFALGFFAEGQYQHLSSSLEPGDCVVVYSDGLPEAQDRSGANYGYERMAETLKATSPAASCDDIIKALMDNFNAFRDGRILKDDVTLVALKRNS